MIRLLFGTNRHDEAQAYGLGFDLVAVTTPGPAETAGAFDEWLASRYAGEMSYLQRSGAASAADIEQLVVLMRDF